MTPASPHPDVLAFAVKLSQIEAVLRRSDEVFWAGKVARARRLAERSDGACVAAYLQLLGGMGSLNDLRLAAPDGVNDRFQAEIEMAYELAQSLQK